MYTGTMDVSGHRLLRKGSVGVRASCGACDNKNAGLLYSIAKLRGRPKNYMIV